MLFGNMDGDGPTVLSRGRDGTFHAANRTDDTAAGETDELRSALMQLQRPRRRPFPDIAEQFREQMERARLEQAQRVRQMQRRAAEAHNTFIGGVMAPIGLLLLVCSYLFHCAAPDAHSRLHARAHERLSASQVGVWLRAATRTASARGWHVHDATRICVCIYFVHVRRWRSDPRESRPPPAPTPMLPPPALVSTHANALHPPTGAAGGLGSMANQARSDRAVVH